MSAQHLFPTAAQMAAARTLLGLTQLEVADGAGVALSTVKRIEGAREEEGGFANVRVTSLQRLLGFYEARGIEFTSSAHRIGISLAVTPGAPD